MGRERVRKRELKKREGDEENAKKRKGAVREGDV